ncbi:c-type cytochrome [Botrimarina sp.]|uniref:c-type cytochrome n=1 Tax=Botrimarina sp. TaxID=2795802 RepID=UPI0032EF2003
MRRLRIKQRLVTLAIAALVVAALGAVVVVGGVVPIRASDGHWPPTKWFLAFSKNRSVATHSTGIQPPGDLASAARRLRGAGHFETACSNCHGTPLRRRSPVTLAMTPTPPRLEGVVSEREPEELFYVVQHGILFAGMPAWPTQQRPDEVWDTVAFLVTLPETDAQAYRELVFPDAAAAPPPSADGVTAGLLATCTRCHGQDGLGRGADAFPHLAGQPREYLLDALEAYADARRNSGMMQAVAAVLTDAERAALADHFAAMPPGGASLDAESASARELVERGREIAQSGLPERGVPSCVDCHGPSEGPRAGDYPRLAGQPAPYLKRQLKLFLQGDRGGGPAADRMRPVAENLPADAFDAVAAYYASLDPD